MLPNKAYSCSNLVFWHHEFDNNRFNLFHNNAVKKRENPKNNLCGLKFLKSFGKKET